MTKEPRKVTVARDGATRMLRRITGAALLTALVVGCGKSSDVPANSGSAGASDPAAMAADPDTRTAVVLPAQGRDLILTEMRGMLTSVQGFVAASAHRDTAGMRIAATASGMAAARDLDPAMQQRLPAEFLRLGMTTHAAWDSLAADVATGKPIDQTLNRLGGIMGNCVACHAQFRINLQR